MSWDNLARALHDALCDELGCSEYAPPETGTHVEHGLRREYWEATAEDVKRYIVSMIRDDPRDRLVESLAAWLHGDECTCPYSVEPADMERAKRYLALAEADSPPAKWVLP